MKHFRCMLLCLSLISAVGLMAGCSCGNPKNETTAGMPATRETTTAAPRETSTQETIVQESTIHESNVHENGTHAGDIYENGTYEGDIYETGNGTYHDTDHTTDHTTDGTVHGTDGGLMEDVTDGLERIGEDITGAVDDVVDGTRARR